MIRLLTLDDLPAASLSGRRVLLRVDFNVPLEDGQVADASRIEAALPTVQELLAADAMLILVSHLGRPKGRRDEALSLRPVADSLSELLECAVQFAEDCVGERTERVIAALEPGEVALLENLRFHPGEEANDPEFAASLAALADTYVNDAFGAAHRTHASIVGVAERIEVRAAGRLMEREVSALGRLLGEVEPPFAALLGGAKITGKMETLSNLLPRLDQLLLGGGMANTFLAAGGYELGESLVEEDRLELAREILVQCEDRDVEVLLPLDLVVADDVSKAETARTVAVDAVPQGAAALDIGEASREAYGEALSEARTLFWNGPLGVFETPPFDAGTRAVASALAKVDAYTVIGGGETVAAAREAGVTERIDHVSTGGGASLAFLAGKTLPGLAVLEADS